MHEGRRGRGLDDDVPIIGDYSDAQNERLRAESREPRSPSSRERRSAGPSIDAPPEPRAPSRAKDDLRPDPRDVRRYAANARRRQQIGPVRKALRFTPIVIAAAAVVGVMRPQPAPPRPEEESTSEL